MTSKTNIDNEQPKTIEEHFQAIINDDTYHKSKFLKVTPDELPSWFNEDLFLKGQAYVRNNLLSMIFSYLTGVIAMLAMPSIAKVFMSTNNSGSPCAAYKRYVRSEILILDLHYPDVKDSASKFYKAINTMRYKHSMVCKRAPINNQDGIRNKDLALTLHDFVVYTLLKPEYYGLSLNAEEREGFVHFWRVIGYFLDIPDRLNVCRKNAYETSLLCEKILNEYKANYFRNVNSDFFYLLNAVIRGMQNIEPTLDVDAISLLFHEVNSVPHHKDISLYSKTMYWYRKAVLNSFQLPIIGDISKAFWNKFVTFLLWLGVNYPLLAWLKFGKQESKLKLYPYSTI